MSHQNKKKFKITLPARTKMLEMIKDLPEIPYLIPNTNGGEPIVQFMTKSVRKKGSEILLEMPEAKSDGKPLKPDDMYTQSIQVPRMQNHQVAIFAAYEKYGDEAIQSYCDQVWDHHYSLKTLPPEPKPLIV